MLSFKFMLSLSKYLCELKNIVMVKKNARFAFKITDKRLSLEKEKSRLYASFSQSANRDF